MEGNSESQDLLVQQEPSGGNVNEASDVSDDCHDSSEQLSLSPAGSPSEAPPSYTPEPQVPDIPSSSVTHDAAIDNCTYNDTPEREYCDTNNEVGDSYGDGECATTTNYGSRVGHSRGASQVSSCEPSVCRMSGRDLCHSRGASTDGSTMEAYPYSASESRRGTYSEAGTLPIGSTIIEENMQGWDRESEKKLSDSEEVGTTYSRKLVSFCDCCQSILRSQHELREHPTALELIKYAFTCPPHGKVGNCLLWLLIGFAFWGCLISITGEEALPGGNFFSLIVLYVFAMLAGEAVKHLGLPSLLGSLVVGILFSSIPGMDVIGSNIDHSWSAALRKIALVIILIRAGLGLDPVALRKLSCIVLRLAFMPCMVEALTMGIVSKFLLDLPWSWSLMLGFVVAAVSPAVVVPCLLKLGEDGYGVEQGIPTLVIAAASLDDVLAITGFSVMMGLTFAKGSTTWTVFKGPFEIFTGIVYGIVFGIVCWYLPYREKKNRAIYKLLLLFGLGGLAMFGSHKVGLESSGAIAVLTVAFVAGLGWRKPGNEDAAVGKYYRFLWEIFQPMLFCLIGAEINVMAIEPSTVGWGLLALVIGLTLRVATSFVVVMGASFTVWERLFIAIAWLPKATVQAAIGSLALDHIQQSGSEPDPEDVTRGVKVVTIAVMVILVTAPLGAAAIKLTGPKFLARKPSSNSPQDSETTV
ncbi:sodium/hydrogen exchanger 9B2-like isoform X1 [Penaeus japonicus]|uniref:sodium/hydrogen exchanger 9B2-like isoform X1 n=1 Tax=Penaeus japonicus TaxID=27405 RepID=UPI001C711493|nr:sodium/hydrogen exchanger 9B2-like isoform X1 [Penaeus japonicus]XP_042891568.1 sodium/hydrogen exchanger 9B2-like isoform X1 [Penaeus japonicus]XP_042891569.1 sodium/hydrogen exchanger 9B2-like isoform X1 [Penaeus japonicus]XP_042891570.1 sodium/hydrogen exchanger 9B2-like isoform X1 [Penaeus japonicus]